MEVTDDLRSEYIGDIIIKNSLSERPFGQFHDKHLTTL